jgi:hypothetical protein
MKVNIEIDCTPEEARSFMGLPDVTQLHAVYLDRMKSLMKDGIGVGDVEKLMANWLPGATMGFEQLQKAMWGAMSGVTGGKGK